MISVAFYNLKGGVGKTTTAVNMAYLAALAGKRTVLWDLDPQAASTWFLSDHEGKTRALKLFNHEGTVAEFEVITPFDNLTLVPADLSLRKVDQQFASAAEARKVMNGLLKKLKEQVDVLIFDCPPSLSPAMEQVIGSVDLVLVPMIPNPLSQRAMAQVLAFFASSSHQPKKLYGFYNQVDMRRRMHLDALASVKKMPCPMFKTYIPMDAAIEQMSLRQAPLASYKASGRAATAYLSLWKELARAIKQQEKVSAGN